MKRDLLLAVFVIMLTFLIAIFGQWVNPSNWPSVKNLFTTSFLQTIGIILIFAVIGFVMWVVLRAIGVLDKAKDTRKIAEMKEAFKQALEEVGLAKEVEGVFASINERLDGIETILKDLVENKKRKKTR